MTNKEIISGREGLWTPIKYAPIPNISELFKEAPKKTQDRLTQNTSASEAYERLKEELDINNADRRLLNLYSGTCNLSDFYGEGTDEKDFSFPSWVYSGIHKLCSELNFYQDTILFHNPSIGRIIGMLPKEIQEQMEKRKITGTVIQDKNLVSDTICRLLYPSLQYYSLDENVVLNERNEGIEGYNKVVKKKHKLIISQFPKEEDIPELADALDSGGVLIVMIPPQFSDRIDVDNKKANIIKKVDVISMMRMQPFTLIENSGYDFGFDILVFRKPTEMDEVYSGVIKTLAGNMLYCLQHFPEELKNATVQEKCVSNEMYKRITILSEQAGMNEFDMVMYLKRILLRIRVTNTTWLNPRILQVVTSRSMDKKPFYKHVLSMIKLKLDEIIKNAPLDIKDSYNFLSTPRMDRSRYDGITNYIHQIFTQEQARTGKTLPQTVLSNPLYNTIFTPDGKKKVYMGFSDYEVLYQLIQLFNEDIQYEVFQTSYGFPYKHNPFLLKLNPDDELKMDVYHGENGFYYVPNKKIDFLTEAIKAKDFLKEYKEKKPLVEMDGLIFLPKDNVYPGSLIIYNDRILIKKSFTTDRLVDLAYNKCLQEYGVSAADRMIRFNNRYNLKSIFSEASRWTSKSDDYLGDLESQLFVIATYSLKGMGDNPIVHLSRILAQIFYKGNMSAYADITETTRKTSHYEQLLELIDFIDIMGELRDDINRGIDTDENKEELLNIIKAYKKKHKLKKISESEVAIEYLKSKTDESKSDDRWFILKALDNALSKGVGIFKPLKQYGEEVFILDMPEYLDLIKSKPDYRTRINVKKLCENSLKYMGTGIYPAALIDFKDRKEFIRQATETGDWIIDVDNIEEGEYIIQKDKYIYGNIGKKLQKIKAFEGHCRHVGINTDNFNLDLIITEIEGILLQIPQIPETIIDLDPHMPVVDFRKHVYPFFESLMKANIKAGDFRIDLTENEGYGRWKYYGYVQDADIVGWDINAIPVTRRMIMNWFNLVAEEKVNRDATGKAIKKETKRGAREDIISDVEFTSMRDIFLRDKFNEFLREKLDSKVREELYENYNSSYAIWIGDTSDEPLEIEGMAKEFMGKPFMLDPYQCRAIRRFIVQHRLYMNHSVGSGKTIGSLASAWLAKQKTIFSKPIFVVLLKNMSQWEFHVKELFPKAKYLIIDNNNKRTAPAEIAFNDYDFILIANSTFEDVIDISAKQEAEFAKKDLEKYFDVMGYLMREYEGGDKTLLKPQLKTVTKYINKELQRIDELIEKSRTDTVEITFDKLGIDALIDDESDIYKNVDTGMDGYLQKVRGIRRVSSGIAEKMRNTSRYIQVQNNIRNRIDMTGTPVSNSATEIYQTLYSITPDNLEHAGIFTFNDFVAAHGRVESVEIVNTQNQIESKPTFAGVRNINQLKRLINACFDVLSQEEMNQIKKSQGKPIPEAIYENLIYPSTPEKILMNYYSQHQVAVLKELALLSKEEKAERSQRKIKLKKQIKQLEAAIRAAENDLDTVVGLGQMKFELAAADKERRLLSFNGGVLYNQIRSGIVHTRLYHEAIDDSLRLHSKINHIVQEALKSFLEHRDKNYPIEIIDGRKYWRTISGLRSVNNGQIFFLDRMGRSDMPDFNARDEYVEAIKRAIPEKLATEKQKDRMFMYIDADTSSVMDMKKVKTFLFDYFDGQGKDYDIAVKYFEALSRTEETEDVDFMATETKKGKIKKKITMRDVAQYLFNEGYVRFLFGSTESMGVGMNLQGSTTDINDIDMPFRPRDFWQRGGRGIRQGNLNSFVRRKTYSSDGGSEVIMLQILRIKENFIRQIFDLKGMDDFTSETAISGLQTGDMDEQGLFLSQLDNMIHATNDKRIQSFVDQRKELETLINREKMYTTVLRGYEANKIRLDRNMDSNNNNTEMYMWLRYELLPQIEKKTALQEETDKIYDAKLKEIMNSEEYTLAMSEKEKKYSDMLVYARDDREKSNILWKKESELNNIKRGFTPERQMVEDFTFARKQEVISKFDWATSFKHEVSEIFFDRKEVVTGVISSWDSSISKNGEKKLVHHNDYDFNRRISYTLGQLSRAVKNKISLIGKVMDSEYEAVEIFHQSITDKDYLATVESAKLAMADDSENNIISQIARKSREVFENQDAYTNFISKQKDIAKYAGYIVSELEKMDNKTDRMLSVDSFIDMKNRYENGEIDELPVPVDFVDEKLVV